MTAQFTRTLSFGPQEVEVSALALGCMGLAGTWDPEEFSADHLKRGIAALETAVEAGITFYDHADIYGRTMCESVFGEFLDMNSGLRERLFLASKCGIILGDEQTPYHYNLSKPYILESVQGSLKRLQTDYIDLYQIHRPDPHTHPRETASALNQLVKDGLVRYIGVSNHLPSHVLALQAYLDVPIVSTQPAISLWNQETMYNGVLDQALEKNIRPLAYSPLGGGVLAGKNLEKHQDDPRLPKLLTAFEVLGEKYNATPAQLSLAWLMQHPAGIIPLFGSNNPENIREAVGATRIELSHEDWYILWSAGRELPLP
ncbi:aldo/keto reductase [Tumebacillus sp. ITR2]|uniref:Aldo/keto reductase n=1 Tax=Tumebacillus amylolyticus TaxID=2801339 RepID=A0ABS1JEG4_9BACL|nr:aldo/keto reductase [Tumebacillus amylolyticus]MBL0388675.1 aldo/keto reductase [Tumebacillus amylolyticus]